MDFLTIVALGASVYALYEIYKIKENSPEKKEKEMKKAINIHEQLSELINKRCEIVIKDAMLLIDVAYSFQGEVIDIDDEWVYIVNTKKSKKQEKIIRISLIKDVKQIHD